MKVYISCSRSLLNRALPHEHLDKLELAGHTVFAPWRDGEPLANSRGWTTKRLMAHYQEAITAADEIHVFWDGASHGVLIELGMALALGKKLINKSGAMGIRSAYDLMDY